MNFVFTLTVLGYSYKRKFERRVALICTLHRELYRINTPNCPQFALLHYRTIDAIYPPHSRRQDRVLSQSFRPLQRHAKFYTNQMYKHLVEMTSTKLMVLPYKRTKICKLCWIPNEYPKSTSSLIYTLYNFKTVSIGCLHTGHPIFFLWISVRHSMQPATCPHG